MSDENERSVASTGSVLPDPLDAIIEGLERIKELEAEIARLRLTNAEREAIRTAADAYYVRGSADGRESVNAATLRGLLERTGGGG